MKKVIFSENSKLEIIGANAFRNCQELNNIIFPDSLLEIREGAFENCNKLSSLKFPNKLSIIGNSAFRMNEGVYCDDTLILPTGITSIGDVAFQGYNAVKKIIINCELKNSNQLGDSIFNNCDSLTSVDADQLITIQENMFRDCKHLSAIFCTNTYWIHKNAFRGCCNLMFTIPDKTKTIEYGALAGVKIVIGNENFPYEDGCLYSKDYKTLIVHNNPKEIIKIREGVENISMDSFELELNDSNIVRNIILPPTVTDRTIMEVLSLPVKYVQLPHLRKADESLTFKQKGIDIWDNKKESLRNYSILAEYYSSEGAFIDSYGAIYSADMKVLKQFSMKIKIDSYTVNSLCEEIADNAFEGYVDPDPEFGVYYLGNNLSKLILPNGLKRIGVDALDGCVNLEELELPDSVEEINDYALQGCRKVTHIVLPTSLKKLGVYSLPAHLRTIDSSSEKFKIYNSCLLEDETLLWIAPGIDKLTLPEKIYYKDRRCSTYEDAIVSEKGELLWSLPNIEHFDFPKDVKVISAGAFCNNIKIKEIKLPFGITTIERGSFEYNQALTDIYLPSTITNIGSLHCHQGWGRKYIEFFYPNRVHIPKGMKKHFQKLMSGIPETRLIEDYIDDEEYDF